ncbi:MAG: hypothetical protein QHJ73_17645, partial [Armatimonadota bacterium]|nr:hypothetical protein [Armatimonadota bacterium]
MTKVCLLFLLSAAAVRAETAGAAEAVCGTWVLQQANSVEELNRLRAHPLQMALKTPYLRGFCLRAPWRAVDEDFALYEAGLKLAREHGVQFSVRFMAGRHTPARVFALGCPSYRNERGEAVPAPVLPDGLPNVVFEREYDRFVGRLARWCRANGVRLLHLPWYGQEWAELYHGREVRALPGYTYDNWLRAHRRLLEIGLKHSGPRLSVEFPLSGHG